MKLNQGNPAVLPKTLCRSALIASALCMASVAQAQTTYNIAGMADFTGPYAENMVEWADCRRVVVDWWNAEVGKGQGVALRVKEYDMRYNAAQVASLWPGVKSELNPVAIMGLGGPDISALQERLPKDKVPLILISAGYGFAWKGDNWVFNLRPTYTHELAGFYTWLQKKSGSSAPLKVGVISSEASPAYVDIHKGVEHFAKENPKVMEVVETIYTEVQPTDLTQQVNRLVRKGATVLQVFNNTASVVAARRALQSVGQPNIPIVLSVHNGLVNSAKALGGDLGQLEGSFQVYSMAMPTDDASPARAFFEKLRAQYKLQVNFGTSCTMGMSQAMVTVRAIEQVVKLKGAAGVTGEAVRAALLSTPIPSERTFGLLPNIKYKNDAPFPTEDLTVNIGTVEKGKFKLAAQNVPVPVVVKW